ncbi:ankyrin repeat [Fusarium albosuccineum]|uniref:Ankyrin repeat n=1 Tax=Fusarium albosuccineum TaxID=1237068 RepID=A0A8H4LC13_9HYPO|nr:ankyrin repeat [Fusarium albosuccineum]
MSLGLIFTLVACAPRVAADSGEEFSNNLFSDLAPLLALFGERVTMQFMSQSMGWADNIILAMAPIGIITVIVSAIRVGGPSWLKALVGRARENIAVAEADLMSSTSHEVCELWNGHHVVRCMGSAPILEFICLVPKYGDRKKVQGVRVISLEEALDRGHVKKIKKSFPDRFRQIHGLVTEHHNYSKLEQGESNDSSSEIIIVHNQREASPNISLNCHGQICRGELYLVAICATLLQSAVLVYSGFVACQLTVPEDEDVVKGYAFPCTFIGMLLLVSGLLICGHVVESSTEEDRYCPAQGTEARLVWLQQPKTVSDQVFDSYAIFPRDARSIVTTSIRKDKAKLSRDERDKPPDKSQHLSRVLETKALVGAIISLCGFIVQFVGLRGMHWSVSVAQLGAILMMAALRALVRRGLAMPPEDKLLNPGFELEWFALTQIDPGKIWWPSSEADAKESETSGNWRVVTAGSSDMHSPLSRETKSPRSEHSKPKSKAHQAMLIRKELQLQTELGQFVAWPAVASIEAAALARAIEITMDALLGLSRADVWSWSLKTHYVDPDGQSEMHFSLQKGELESLTRELEAALSLWLFSVNQYESDQGLHKRHNRIPGISISSKGPLQNLSLRLLGGYDKSLHRDLDWWMPNDATRILRVQEFDWVKNAQNDDADDTQKVLDVPNHRIVGCGSRENCTSPALPGQARYQSSPLSKLHLDGQREKTETLPRADDSLRAYLAAESSVHLKLLYAQDMFTAFMWSVAKTMPSCIPGSSDLVHNDQGKKGEWKSFRLRHEELSRMVQDISNTGLGSLDQIYLSVIPPLSAENKLPETKKIIELARKQARRPQEKQDWIQDSKPYLWLFETAQTFPKDAAISVRTIAALLDYVHIMTRALDLREPLRWSESGEEGEAEEPLVKTKMIIEDKIKEWLGPGEDLKTRTIFSYLRTLCEEQGREWRWETEIEPRATPESVAEYPQAFGFSELHRLYQKPGRLISREIRASLNRGQGMDQQDVFNWTPLHYAAAKGNASAARRLLEYEADLNVRDLVDWTPLHYACQHGNTSIVEELLLAQADLNLRGIDGVTPLHCAAMSGCIDAAKSLIKAKATADATDNAGNTWLHWAAFHGHAKFMVELKAGVDINLTSHNGRNPLHLASAKGHDAVVRILAGNGADIGAEDDANQTPLHLAAANGREAVVEVLVERGARIDVRNRREETPLHLAAKRGHRAVTEYLESCSR